MTGKHRGFTLIELMVVVSIVVFLLAVLLPTLRSARELAKGSLCTSNLRQLSYGWHMYADASGDACVPGRMFNHPGDKENPANWYDVGNGMKYRPRWAATVGGFVSLYAFDNPRTDEDRQDYDGDIYRCPSADEWIDERNFGYGYNHQFLGNARRTAGRCHNFPVIRSRILHLPNTVLFADCMGTAAGVPLRGRKPYANGGTDYAELGNHAWTLDPPRLTEQSDRGTGDPDSPRTAVDPRHGERSNIMYCDGHGERLRPYALGYRILENGAYADSGGGEFAEDPPTNLLFSGLARDADPPARPE